MEAPGDLLTRAGILVVDDEETTCNLVADVLRQTGFGKVFTARNGVEALSVIEAEADGIFAVVLDLFMPAMNGMDLMRHLVNVHKTPVGIIVLTGHSEVLSREEFYRLGTDVVMAMDYVIKPFSIEAIVADAERTIHAVAAKRSALLVAANSGIHRRLDAIEAAIDNLSKRQHGFLAQLGLDLIRAILVALALLTFLFFGVGDFVRRVFENR